MPRPVSLDGQTTRRAPRSTGATPTPRRAAGRSRTVHRLDAVHQEVDHDLLQLHAVAQHGGRARCEIGASRASAAGDGSRNSRSTRQAPRRFTTFGQESGCSGPIALARQGARSRRTTSLARGAFLIMRLDGALDLGRASGTGRLSQRRPASPLATMAASGWLTSWAIDAVSSPRVATRETWASSMRGGAAGCPRPGGGR